MQPTLKTVQRDEISNSAIVGKNSVFETGRDWTDWLHSHALRERLSTPQHGRQNTYPPGMEQQFAEEF